MAIGRSRLDCEMQKHHPSGLGKTWEDDTEKAGLQFTAQLLLGAP